MAGRIAKMMWGFYRTDMRTQGDSQAPHVQQIAFDAPALLDVEGVTH